MLSTVRVPQLSGAGAVTIERWLRAEGEHVRKGQPLAVLAVDKATLEIAAPAGGILRRVLIGPGERATAGAPLALIGRANDAIAAEQQTQRHEDTKTQGSEAKAGGTPAVRLPPAPVSLPREGRARLSPRARRKARELNLPVEALPLPGEERRIIEKDVLAAAELLKTAESGTRPAEGGWATRPRAQRAPLHPLRRQIALAAAYSQQAIPQFSIETLVNAEPLLAAQKKLGRQDGRRAPGVEDFALLALARTLAEDAFQPFRAVIDGDDLICRGEVNLGLTVALDDGQMLVPVLRCVDRLKLSEIGSARRELSVRARQRTLAAAELGGGVFTLAALPGVRSFRPLVRPGESAVLALPDACPGVLRSRNGFKTRLAWALTLCADQRLVDGALAARFLSKISALLECPDRLIC